MFGRKKELTPREQLIKTFLEAAHEVKARQQREAWGDRADHRGAEQTLILLLSSGFNEEQLLALEKEVLGDTVMEVAEKARSKILKDTTADEQQGAELLLLAQFAYLIGFKMRHKNF